MKGLLLLKTRIVLGSLIGAALVVLLGMGTLDTVEDLTVDYRLRLRKPQSVSDQVRLVGIGDNDVGSFLGRWPFPRAVHGDVLNILNAVGVKHSTFDILFTEPSAYTNQDEKLKSAFQKQTRLTLAYHFENAGLASESKESQEETPHFLPDGARYGLALSRSELVRGQKPIAPFEALSSNYGAVNVVPDADGVIRRVPLFFVHGNRLYPSLALQTVMTALGVRADQVAVEPGVAVTLVETPQGNLRIPIDEHGQYRINYLGDVGVFSPAFEYVDLYQAVESPEAGTRLSAAMKDRIVLVGLVSTGNTDVVNTSVGRLPGVAVQATVVSDILTGNHLRFLPLWQQGLLLVLAGALVGACMLPARAWLGIGAFFVLTTFWVILSIGFANTNVMLPMTSVLLTFGLATLLLLGIEAAALKQDRSRVVTVLGQYISRPLLQRLIHTEPRHAASAGLTERRELTIFFSDIRGFTAWTERVEPDEVATRLNEYFTAMTPLVEQHGGTLDKFIGDCVMVFFGAPVTMQNHAVKAVEMAVAMQQEMTRLNESWAKRGYDPLQIGIGIHTGFVTVGSFGSAAFLDYTVIGRAVNMTARIQSQAPGGVVLISARTQSLVKSVFPCAPYGEFTLKGIPEPQQLFEVQSAPS